MTASLLGSDVFAWQQRRKRPREGSRAEAKTYTQTPRATRAGAGHAGPRCRRARRRERRKKEVRARLHRHHPHHRGESRPCRHARPREKRTVNLLQRSLLLLLLLLWRHRRLRSHRGMKGWERQRLDHAGCHQCRLCRAAPLHPCPQCLAAPLHPCPQCLAVLPRRCPLHLRVAGLGKRTQTPQRQTAVGGCRPCHVPASGVIRRHLHQRLARGGRSCRQFGVGQRANLRLSSTLLSVLQIVLMLRPRIRRLHGRGSAAQEREERGLAMEFRRVLGAGGRA